MGGKLTRQRLRRFIRMRNKSRNRANVSWVRDAITCGFMVDDLGPIDCPAPGVFEWTTPAGILTETDGHMTLVPLETADA